MPQVKLLSRDDLMRINDRSRSLGLVQTLPPEICDDVEPGITLQAIDPIVSDDVVRVTVVLTPMGTLGTCGVLDMAREDYEALPWSRLP